MVIYRTETPGSERQADEHDHNKNHQPHKSEPPHQGIPSLFRPSSIETLDATGPSRRCCYYTVITLQVNKETPYFSTRPLPRLLDDDLLDRNYIFNRMLE